MPSFGSPIEWPSLVTSGWWDDRSYRGGVHEGLDFRAPIGTRVYAIASGKVTTSDTVANSFAGKWVGILHADGWTSRYMHLSKLLVSKGDRVEKGQLIGLSGDTSNPKISGAPHLHFDLKVDDPAKYIALFGKPSTGFGKHSSVGVGVPAEPLIPVAEFRTKVRTQAAKHGIPFFRGTATGIGLLELLFLGGVLWFVLK